MGFWDSAAENLNTGYGYGVRQKEREEDKKIREKEFGLKATEHRARMRNYGLQQEASQLALDEAKEQRQFDLAKKMFLHGQNQLQSGDELGAASIWTEAYNKYVPDGNEAMIILPQTQPDVFQNLIATGQIDPKYSDAKVLLVDKKRGIVPMESLQQLGENLAGQLNMNNWLNMRKERTNLLNTKNAEAQKAPYMDNDGNWWADTYKMNPDGTFSIEQSPYTGPVPVDATRKKIFGLGIDPDSPKGQEMAKVLAGVKGAEPSDFAKSQANRQYGLQKGQAERDKKRLGMTEEEHKLKMQKLEKSLKAEFSDTLATRIISGAEAAADKNALEGEERTKFVEGYIKRATDAIKQMRKGKMDKKELRADLIKNGYSEADADAYIKKAEELGKL